jgi:glucan phosphoethanolaminetransferase (alkaline phosphatase superfamily)
VTQELNDRISQNSIFLWIALATGAVLLVPLVAMRFTGNVNWDAADFIVMGCLLFGTGSLFVLTARQAPRRHRVIIGSLFVIVFLYAWAELAVGVFTNLGS